MICLQMMQAIEAVHCSNVPVVFFCEHLLKLSEYAFQSWESPLESPIDRNLFPWNMPMTIAGSKINRMGQKNKMGNTPTESFLNFRAVMRS